MTDHELDDRLCLERAHCLALASMDPASVISESARKAIMQGITMIDFAERLRAEGRETKQTKALLGLRDLLHLANQTATETSH